MAAALLYTLTHKLQADVLSNLAATLFAHCADPLRAAARQVKFFQRQRLVITYEMMVTTKTRPLAPLTVGRAGDPKPSFASFAHILRHRWNGEVYAETFITATREANRRMGGSCGFGRAIRPVDADHHHLLALTYTSLDEHSRRLWRPEQELKAWTGYVPDALLRGRRREDDVLIEIGGKSYSAERLETVLAAAEERRCSWRIY